MPWEHRLRYQSFEHFRISRSYFFGVGLLPVRAGKELHPQKYRCCLKNLKHVHCVRLSDPWGHHVLLCEVTSKHAEHNVLRDTLRSFGSRYGFISDSEIPVSLVAKAPRRSVGRPSRRSLVFFIGCDHPCALSGNPCQQRRHFKCSSAREECLRDAGWGRSACHRSATRPVRHYQHGAFVF